MEPDRIGGRARDQEQVLAPLVESADETQQFLHGRVEGDEPSVRIDVSQTIEVPQTYEPLGPATRAFYDAVVTGRIAHDGDPTLAAHLRSVLAVPLGDHGWRLRKITRNSARKIDGAFAAVMAVAQALAPAPPKRVGAFLA